MGSSVRAAVRAVLRGYDEHGRAGGASARARTCPSPPSRTSTTRSAARSAAFWITAGALIAVWYPLALLFAVVALLVSRAPVDHQPWHRVTFGSVVGALSRG